MTMFNWFVRVVGLLILAFSPTQIALAHGKVLFDDKCNVQRFHGVPLNLTISSVKRLPYRVKMGHEYAEGDRYATALINAVDDVKVKVSFGSDGKLSAAETSSLNAVGPKGIKVGSPLSDLKAAWPTGRLLWGVEENKAFVTFVTGTNVLFDFSPKDMPLGTFAYPRKSVEVPNIRVRSIRVSLTTVLTPDSCVPGYCL